MMTRNDAVAMQLFCVMMTFSDTLPVLSTKNDGHCHHSRMGVFPDYYLRLARETMFNHGICYRRGVVWSNVCFWHWRSFTQTTDYRDLR